MRLVNTMMAALLFAAGLSAQDYGISRTERIAAAVEERFAARDRERQRNALAEQEQFLRRASDFVRQWNAFVAKYNQGNLDARAASDLSRAFHRMEQSGCWPKPESRAGRSTRPQKEVKSWRR